MKKILFVALLASTLSATSQVLLADDFNSLNLGAVSTDLTGGTVGQGDWSVIANNGTDPTTTSNTSETNFEIISEGNNGTQGLKMETANGDKGQRFMFNGVDWENRTEGNDIIKMEFDFYTGDQSTSTAPINIDILGLEGPTLRTLSGLFFIPNTRRLTGVAYLNNNGTFGTFVVNLGQGNAEIILDSNTWYRLGVSYNTTNGEISWSGPGFDGVGIASQFLAGPFAPVSVQFASFTSDTNTSSTTINFDNLTVEASNTDELLSSDDNFTATDFSIYPNPASDIININLGNLQIKQVQITDINGRVVKTFETEITSEAQINIQNLNSGLYMMSIFTNEGVRTSKFINIIVNIFH